MPDTTAPTSPRSPSTRSAEPDQLALTFASIAASAGRAILEVYASAEPHVRRKADRSLVCDADERAEAIILERLAEILPGVPVLAEEAIAAGVAAPILEGAFLLVDPVDGTRHFVDRSGQFSVNIALVEAGAPQIGCIYAPLTGAATIAGRTARIGRVAVGEYALADDFRVTRTRPYPEALSAIMSASCVSQEDEMLMAALNVGRRIPMGSALKFAAIAAGEADVYPRHGATMEWDTAAGDAILRAAGGRVVAPDGSPLRYGKVETGFKNGAFIAWGGEPLVKLPF